MNEKQKLDSLKRRYGRRPSQSGAVGGGGMRRHHGPGARMAAKGGRPKEAKAAIRRLMTYLKEDKAKMGLAFVCVVLNTFGTLAGAYMLRPIINTYIVPIDGSRGDAAGAGTGAACYGGSLCDWGRSQLCSGKDYADCGPERLKTNPERSV